MFKTIRLRKYISVVVSHRLVAVIRSFPIGQVPPDSTLSSRQMPTQAYNASTIIQADGVIVALVKLLWLLIHRVSRASRLRLRSWLARSRLASQLLTHRLANSTSAPQSKRTWRVQNSQIRIQNDFSANIHLVHRKPQLTPCLSKHFVWRHQNSMIASSSPILSLSFPFSTCSVLKVPSWLRIQDLKGKFHLLPCSHICIPNNGTYS